MKTKASPKKKKPSPAAIDPAKLIGGGYRLSAGELTRGGLEIFVDGEPAGKPAFISRVIRKLEGMI